MFYGQRRGARTLFTLTLRDTKDHRDSTVKGSDSTRPHTTSCMEAPDGSLDLLALPKEMYHYQAKEKEGSWLNVAQRKISKIPHGEAQALEGHSVSTRMLSSHRYDHHPLPCGFNSSPSPYQEVALPLTTGQKELWASLFNDRKAINTADLQLFFF